MTTAPIVNKDLDQLLKQAPAAVDSYFPGHWDRMPELEERAKRIVREQDIGSFPKLLYDVAVLKQPRFDHRWLSAAIEKSPGEAARALEALGNIDRLDYGAMESLARVPGFGTTEERRAFNSAVFRLVRPQSFGIIDWRNLAVLMSSHGFEGLMEPPVRFDEFSADDVLRKKGKLILTQRIYERYNDILRAIARRYGKSVAEVDLALWTFSILKRPFSPFQPRQSVVQPYQITSTDRRLLRSGQHSIVARQIVGTYLTGLAESDEICEDAMVDELCALFALVRDESALYARNSRSLSVKEKIRKVVNALDSTIKSRSLKRLLGLWSYWNDLVDTTSSSWIGIDLPGSMFKEGYMILAGC